jgi:hypothetical protein
MIEDLFLGIEGDPVAVPDGEYVPQASTPVANTHSFAGVYYSDELQTAYDIRENGTGLVARHAVNGTITLQSDDGDRFRTDRWFMPSVAFVRGSDNAISGFRVTSDGARNILFRRTAP